MMRVPLPTAATHEFMIMRLALNLDAPGIVQLLQENAPELEIVHSSAPRAQLQEVEVLLTPAAGASKLSELLSACPRLKWIHILGTGVDDFPLELVGDQRVTCSRGATASPIAEWVMAMILCFEKKLPDSWVVEPPQSWYVANLGGLEGKTLGLLGFGAIGQAVARRALAFDMRVLAKVRQHRESPLHGVEFIENLDHLLPQVDHLVLALPATAESSGLIGKAQLLQTKPGVHLINVARATLLDQASLRPFLDSGHVAAASLDVVEPEPLPAGHWLYEHPRVRLSPHISWSSVGIVSRMLGVFLRNVRAYRQGAPLEGLVDRSAGY